MKLWAAAGARNLRTSIRELGIPSGVLSTRGIYSLDKCASSSVESDLTSHLSCPPIRSQCIWSACYVLDASVFGRVKEKKKNRPSFQRLRYMSNLFPVGLWPTNGSFEDARVFSSSSKFSPAPADLPYGLLKGQTLSLFLWKACQLNGKLSHSSTKPETRHEVRGWDPKTLGRVYIPGSGGKGTYTPIGDNCVSVLWAGFLDVNAHLLALEWLFNLHRPMDNHLVATVEGME